MNDLVKPIDKKFNLPASSGMAAIIPRNMDEVWRLAQAVSLSGLAPNDMKEPEKVMVAILHGMELGIKPMQAIQRIAVINGRPSLWGDAALGLVTSSGLLEDIEETVEGEGDNRTAICTVKRAGSARAVVRKFSVLDAKTAKLWGKASSSGKPTPWVTHPDRMMQMRARAFALRDTFADVLGGMYLAEELQGETIDAPAIPTPPTPPRAVISSGNNTVQTDPGFVDNDKIAEGPNRAERGALFDEHKVLIPLGALTDFDAFHKALDSCPTLESLNAMFDALTKRMNVPDDLAEARDRYNEVSANKFGDQA